VLETIRRWGRPLVLEAGNFMEIDVPRAARANALILDRLEQEGEPAITPGPRELSAWPAFDSLMAPRSIPVVSSNLRVREDGATHTIGSRTALLSVEGVRVGVLGILGAEPYRKVSAPVGVEFIHQDPASAIRELLPGLRREAEIVVVLGCVTDAEATALAAQVDGVDLWISGYDSITSDRPVRKGETLFDRTGQRGQYLSVTHLIVSPKGVIIDWGGRNIPLDAKVPVEPRVDSLVAQVDGTAAGGCR
jgi:2',3'-cyclic-nucleotide 2'-phosphodiesterase (5'-nucleotidase family)